MKRIFIVLFVCLCGLVACKKDKFPRSEYPFVYLNHCISQRNDSDRIKICLDEVVSDNRCPENMFCVLEGTAVAKFTFSIDGVSHRLTLSTQPLNVPFAKDTVVENYRFEFVDLKPVPAIGPNKPNSDRIYAQVKISTP
jgi:hypothetical protein